MSTRTSGGGGGADRQNTSSNDGEKISSNVGEGSRKWIVVGRSAVDGKCNAMQSAGDIQ